MRAVGSACPAGSGLGSYWITMSMLWAMLLHGQYRVLSGILYLTDTNSRKMAWRLQLLNSSGPTMWKSYIPPLFSLHLRISQSFRLDSVWNWWNNILQHSANHLTALGCVSGHRQLLNCFSLVRALLNPWRFWIHHMPHFCCYLVISVPWGFH